MRLYLMVVSATLITVCGCGGHISQGRMGFDLTKDQQAQLRKEKDGCERMGGQFFVQVNAISTPPTYDIVCDLPSGR